MQIGPMDKRIELQAFTSVSDNMGGFVNTWTTQDVVYAAIWPVPVKEMISGGVPTMVATHQVRIRYHADVRAGWRVKYGSRYFSIDGIVNKNERNVQHDLICREVLP